MKILIYIYMLAFCIAEAHAESLCATKSGLAYVTVPQSGQPLPSSAERISIGTTYLASKRLGDYVAISVKERTLWAEQRLFSAASKCKSDGTRGAGIAGTKSATSAKSNAGQSPLPNATAAKPKSSASCACGSGRLCIGPRGGRYCIKGGGKKRYGV
jgi:hypothetical protein